MKEINNIFKNSYILDSNWFQYLNVFFFCLKSLLFKGKPINFLPYLREVSILNLYVTFITLI